MRDARLKVPFVHCTIFNLSLEEACGLVMERLRAGLQTRVYFINAHKFYLMEHSRDFAHVVRCADIRLADGQSILWAAGKLKAPIDRKVPGIDLFFALLEKASQSGFRAFFLGGGRKSVLKAFRNAARRYGDNVAAGFHYGYFDEGQNEAIVEKINDSGADLLFTGFGSPRQECWIHAHAHKLRARVLMGVGGSLDVIAGAKKRAPAFFTAHGLEWLWRFFQSPLRRARRVFVENAYFVWRVLKLRKQGVR